MCFDFVFIFNACRFERREITITHLPVGIHFDRYVVISMDRVLDPAGFVPTKTMIN